MTRINLVAQPIKDTTPKVWHNGQWKNAESVDVVVTHAGKIKPELIPDVALIANSPEYDENKAWKTGDIVYKNKKLYRANSAIPATTSFKEGDFDGQWTPVSVSDQIINTRDWLDYNSNLSSLIKSGEMFYYRTDLYRAKVNNTGKAITDGVYFEKLSGYKQLPFHTTTLSYTKDELTLYSGTVAKANADIPSGIDFTWGTVGVTFRPELHSGSDQLTWKGVVDGVSKYGYGDVVALYKNSDTLFMRVESIPVVVAPNTTQYELKREGWVPVVAGVPQLAATLYKRYNEDVIAFGFKKELNYIKDSIISVDSQLWLATDYVVAGEEFNVGKQWIKVGNSDTPISGITGRRLNMYAKPTGAPVEYFEQTDKVMLLHRPDNSWAMHDGTKNAITFPTNPKDKQVFSSDGTTYTWNNNKEYWVLTSKSSDTRERGYFFGKASTQTGITNNSMLSTWTAVRTVGDTAFRHPTVTGKITVKAGYTYKITYNVACSALGGNWLRIGMYNETDSTWISDQMYASIWPSGSNSSVGYTNSPTGIVYFTPTADKDLSMRAAYWGGAASNLTCSITSGGEGSSDGGDTWVLIEEINGSPITDARNNIVLEGDRVDYLMAQINGTQSFAASTMADIQFTKNVVSIGEVVNTSGVFTLKANKTYELISDVFAELPANGRFAYAWYYDNNTIIPNGTYGAKTATNSGEAFSTQSAAIVVITPVEDTKVKVRTTYITGASKAYDYNNSLGTSYVIIRQLGSSKVTTSELVVSKDDPKNYWTRDVINNTYSPSKHITDWFFTTHTADLKSSQIALRVGETKSEKQARAWFLFQKFNLHLSGTGDNDMTFDSLLGVPGYHISMSAQLFNSGRFNGTGGLVAATGDVDPTLTGGTGNTSTLSGSATEYYKLCIGRDAADNIHWITLAPYTAWNTTAQAVIPNFTAGCAVWNGSSWVYPTASSDLYISNASSMTSSGATSQSNNVCNSSTPLIQYMPHRLELA